MTDIRAPPIPSLSRFERALYIMGEMALDGFQGELLAELGFDRLRLTLGGDLDDCGEHVVDLDGVESVDVAGFQFLERRRFDLGCVDLPGLR